MSAALVGGFTFGLPVSDTSIVFTSVTTDMVLPYVLWGDSFTLTSFGLTDISTVSGAQSVVASDLSDSGNGVTIAANTQFGLGRVFFDVTPPP